MKKSIQVLLVVALAIATSVSMAACKSSASTVASSSEAISSSASSSAVSSEDTASSKDAVSSEDAASSEADSSKAESKSANLKLPSLEEYVKTPEMQSNVKSLIAAVAKEGCKFDVSVDGNKMIYSYTYLNKVKVDAKQLDSVLKQKASVFENLATALKQSVSTENPVVVVRYLDSNNKLITSKEFTAK